MKRKQRISDILSCPLIAIFLYTGLSKAFDQDIFVFTLSRSPWHLLQANAVLVSWVLPYLEILVAVALIIPIARLWGFYASTFLMSAFLLYVTIIVASGVVLPCSCGGVISYLTWQQHIAFNALFTGVSVWGTLNERGIEKRGYRQSTILT